MMEIVQNKFVGKPFLTAFGDSNIRGPHSEHKQNRISINLVN